MDTSLNKLVEFYLNNIKKFSPLISTHCGISYPQNGDRIVTIDSATSLHPVFTQLYNTQLETEIVLQHACAYNWERTRVGLPLKR